MRSKLFSLISVLFFIGLSVQAQKPLPANAEVFYQKAMRSINQKHINWIKSTAQNVNKQKMDESAIQSSATTYANENHLANTDIIGLVCLIMVEAAKQANQDLRNLAQETDKLNKEKQKLRDAEKKMEQMKQDQSMSKQRLDSFRLIARPVSNLPQTKPVKRTNVFITTKPSVSEIKQVQDDLKSKLDSMNEISMMSQVRLQMMMTAYDQTFNTLSNIMKKISQTQDGIIQNLK